VGGEVVGDPAVVIRSVAGLAQAGEGDISFLANPRYSRQVKTTGASAVLVKAPLSSQAAMVVCPDPYYAFMQVTVMLHGHRRHPLSGTSERASIAASARVGEGAAIGDFVSLSEDVRIGARCTLYPGVFVGPQTTIGDDCILYANAVIYDRCRIGNRVIIHANATVGEDGFGFSTHKGIHHKIPHISSVVIEDDVELGAGCGIERGAVEDTIIGHGTKVGPHCLLVPQVGIAGSTTLGHHCVAAGQVGIAGHLKIGNGVIMGGQAGVGEDVEDGVTLLGSPAFEANKAKRALFLIRRLPDMWRALKQLKRRLDAIDGKQA
jgi:UDP-3-O-[3-hydroxymyristoyl] glucosamine N-acyltransferase